ncbi:MAG: tRNA lysidine(34) synthetase TilS [Desulfovibrionaceae bacterium CG1_02_65_16]|nr:MAG: tRNA lysidine(34) synthetase TilS [Desulfovibrionaceae bacterium CG1_02_65_16]
MERPLPLLEDLPAKWARFCLGVETFAVIDLGCGFTREGCVVACSGGADSTALLLLAALLCRKNGGSIMAVHLDHCLRPDSGEDAGFVRALCEHWSIPLVLEAADVQALADQAGIGLEEAGRNARYALFERVRRQCGAQRVLVAHQLNDLAEDQLMRLVRGVGWPSLGGMPAVDDTRHLLRPLLLTPRAVIEAFLTACGQSWRVDASNFTPAATRNRLRHGVLPALMRENPGYLAAAKRLWRQARLDASHLDAQLAPLLAQLPRTAPGEPLLLPATLLNAADPALRLRLFKIALERLGPGQPLADALFRLDELWRQHATEKSLRFPGDKEARLIKSGVEFKPIDRKKECG